MGIPMLMDPPPRARASVRSRSVSFAVAACKLTLDAVTTAESLLKHQPTGSEKRKARAAIA
jgi:hypothetical protein